MNPKKIRIALTDPLLAAALKALPLSVRPEFLVIKADALSDFLGKVDLFLLDDDTAIRFLGRLSEDSWPAVAVTAYEDQGIPGCYIQGLVDDLLVLPPRMLDLERVIRNHDYLQALRDLEESSKGVAGLVRQLQEDINLAQKIQRRLIRDKFSPLGPLTVKSKYWCGLKSGGDYFDLFEFPGGTHAGLILADSSSYALSTSLIGSLMQFSVHVGREDLENPQKIVQMLFAKVKEGMKEKDKLSLFYGVLDRKTYALKFVDCGGIYAAKRSVKGGISWGGKGEHAPLSLEKHQVPQTRELTIEPGDRLMVCSDGWGEALGESMPGLVEQFLGKQLDSQELLNEMAFSLRRKLEKDSEDPLTAESEFPMPPQDCSALIFDLAPNVLRLAR